MTPPIWAISSPAGDPWIIKRCKPPRKSAWERRQLLTFAHKHSYTSPRADDILLEIYAGYGRVLSALIFIGCAGHTDLALGFHAANMHNPRPKKLRWINFDEAWRYFRDPSSPRKLFAAWQAKGVLPASQAAYARSSDQPTKASGCKRSRLPKEA